jgi:ribonucleoside-triphosphate reductase
MILKVEKRDTRKRKFEPKHIYDAIEAAFKESHEQYCDETLDDLVAKVIASLELLGKKTVPVETIQDTIYAVLKDNQYVDTAVAFEEYRRERTRIRMIKSEVMRIIREIKQADLPSSNILRDNANESGGTPAGMYGKIASEVNKMFNLLDVVNRKYAEEHTNGYMHIHDLNQYDLTFNCLFAPVGKLLKSGFDSGTGFQRPAQSIQSATALTAVILQLQSNQQFGGIACDNFDFEMAPFVDRSFLKNLAKELNSYAKKTGDPQYSEFTGRFKTVKKRLIELLRDRGVSMNLPVASLYAMFPQDCVDEAIDTTDDDTHQAMEALVHNLNSLQSRSGNQVPFSSLNFGLDTSNCGRMASKNLIRAQYEGMGDGLTAIFPILIFKLMKGYTKLETDPNFDLYIDAIHCLARRFYPNFVKVDSKFNLPYVKYNVKTIDASGTIVFKVRGTNDTVALDRIDKTQYTVYEYQVTPTDFWEVVSYDGKQLQLRKLIENTTISTMGCRTRVIGNVNGTQQTTGRGNLAFHTINLPRLAIEAHIEESTQDARVKLFFEKLDVMLEDAKGSLIDRFKLIAEKTYEKYPFTMQQGLYLTSDDKPHAITDKIGEVMKQSTLSIGYIGIAETITLLTSKTYGVDADVHDLAVSIVKHIRDFCDECQKETHLNWSCFATPAEAVAGRFANIDKHKFQNEKKLADVDLYRIFGKGYYTNSHMMDFSLDTTLENKIKTEAPFHALSNAGHIFYYKMNGDLSKNVDAVKAVIDTMYDGDLGYFTVTMDSDDCLECGFHGIIDNECPKCHCTDENKFVRVRRITGYLTGAPRKSILRAWGDGKLAELKDRHNI